MNRQGPSLLAWLLGRFTYPPSSTTCTQCGRPGADATAAHLLQHEDMPKPAALARLCPACRRTARTQALRLQHSQKSTRSAH